MKIQYPYLCLAVSKEYTKIYLVSTKDNKKLLGKTIDDTVGEAFDKVAKLLWNSNSGWQLIEKLSKEGDESQYDFPRPMLDSDNFNLSFTELERAVKKKIKDLKKECEPHKGNKKLHKELCKNWAADVAASFQEAIVDTLVEKLMKAVRELEVETVAMSGKISTNSRLRDKLGRICHEMDIDLYYS